MATRTHHKAAIILGSDSDIPALRKAGVRQLFERFGIELIVEVCSAHWQAEALSKLCKRLVREGVRVFGAAGGCSLALPGAVAAEIRFLGPVVAMPLTSGASPWQGQDALLSNIQLPPGRPLATMGIDSVLNGALLMIQMLAVGDDRLVEELSVYFDEQEQGKKRARSVDPSELQTEKES